MSQPVRVPYSVVFSGGGALGAWEVGCYRRIYEKHDTPPKIVTGASAGAINAVGVALSMSADELEYEWKRINSKDVYRPRGLLKKATSVFKGAWGAVRNLSFNSGYDYYMKSFSSFYDTWPLKNKLNEMFSHRFAKFKESGVDLAISVSNAKTRRSTVFYRSEVIASIMSRQHRDWKELDANNKDSLVESILASTAVPLMFPPQGENREYLDGGVTLNHPIVPAIQLGAKLIYVLVPTPLKSEGKLSNCHEILENMSIHLTSASLFAQLDDLLERNKLRENLGRELTKVCMIRPEIDLDVDFLSFGDRVDQLVRKGEASAERALKNFKEDDRSTWFEPR